MVVFYPGLQRCGVLGRGSWAGGWNLGAGVVRNIFPWQETNYLIHLYHEIATDEFTDVEVLDAPGMQFAWKDSHVASSQNHLYKMKSLRFTKPSYYKILALNSTQGIPHHPFNLCLQCCGAWSNLGVRFRTSSSGRLPNFWRCQHQALFYLFLSGHVLSFFWLSTDCFTFHVFFL